MSKKKKNLSTCLHFLVAATDNPMLPAPAYKSTTDDPYGTYFCNLLSNELNAYKDGHCL